MKWITRECPKISRFIDKDAEFLYVPNNSVLTISNETGATPYDIPEVELTHEGASQRK